MSFIYCHLNFHANLLRPWRFSLIARRPSDCDDIYSRRSGVYKIYPKGSAKGFNVYCDMKTDGGRWTVSIIQKYRQNTFPILDD